MSSALLLGMILLIYRRAAWWRHLLLLPACLIVAFVFNLLRIFAIVTLAPRFPGHYTALHEIAGIVALYSALGVVWWLTGRAQAASPKKR
jgi:exosortase/archaeosortase family protein